MKKKIFKLFFYVRKFKLFRHILWLHKRKRIFKLHGKINDVQYLKMLFKNTFGRYPNLDNPLTYNEKLLWLKLHWRNPLCYETSDKYSVRNYVTSCDCSDLLLPLIGVYKDISEIDFNSLPDSFVMKTTHDSGGIFICRNKLDAKSYDKGIKKIEMHFKKNHSNTFLEWVYDKTNPRIIVEPIIETKDNKPPKDYKFFCFNGEPKYFFVTSDRSASCKFDFFDLEGNWIKVENGHPHSRKAPELPDNLNQMINYCRLLSKPFAHVRVDLYSENGRIYFGELTFFHHAGDETFEPDSFDYLLGKELDLAKIPKGELL